jgi:hypothetical protein
VIREVDFYYHKCTHSPAHYQPAVKERQKDEERKMTKDRGTKTD